MQGSLIKLKYKVLIITFFIICTIAAIRLYDDYLQHKQTLHNKITQSKNMFHSLFEEEKHNIDNLLTSRALCMAKNQTIANALLHKDRQKLLEETLFRFELLQQEQPSIKRFHYHTNDGYSLLRMHNIHKFGDNTFQTKPIIAKALSSKTPKSGFEYGLSDATFISFRVAVPSFVHNTNDLNNTTTKDSIFAGLIEIQYDFTTSLTKIVNIMDKINSHHNKTECLVVFNSNSVRTIGEEKFIKINNDTFIPTIFTQHKELLLASLQHDKDGMFEFNNKKHVVFDDDSIIVNHNNQSSGKIVVIMDISHEEAACITKAIQGIVKPILVLITLLFVFNWLFDNFLRASNQLTKRKSAILNLQQNIVIVTNGKEIIDANTSMLSFFGYNKLSDFTAEHQCICEFFLYKEGQNFIQAVQDDKTWAEYILAHQDKNHKVLLLDKMGQERIFDIKVTIYDNDTKNIEMIVVLNDITDIEKRNEELEEFIDSTIEGIIVSYEGTIIDVNRSALKIYNAENKTQFVGKKVLDFIALESVERVKEKLIQDDTEPYEINIVKFNGEIAPAIVKGRNIQTDGKTIHLSAVVDISKIKALEEEARQKEKMMFHQSKMAAMGEMIGNIAHQWRQPLSAISVAASGMKMQYDYGMLDETNLKYGIDGIMKHTQFLSQTIDDFRDFFKADKNEKLINLSQSVHKTINLLEANFKNKEIDIIFTREDLIETLALENELTQAIMNILNNAKDVLLEQTHAARKLIMISITKEDICGVIEITDSGGGVPSEIKERIFEPYFTTKHQSQGTGIGLFMTKEIITRHMHGEIEVVNEAFNFENLSYFGAKFILKIPIK